MQCPPSQPSFLPRAGTGMSMSILSLWPAPSLTKATGVWAGSVKALHTTSLTEGVLCFVRVERVCGYALSSLREKRRIDVLFCKDIFFWHLTNFINGLGSPFVELSGLWGHIQIFQRLEASLGQGPIYIARRHVSLKSDNSCLLLSEMHTEKFILRLSLIHGKILCPVNIREWKCLFPRV